MFFKLKEGNSLMNLNFKSRNSYMSLKEKRNDISKKCKTKMNEKCELVYGYSILNITCSYGLVSF